MSISWWVRKPTVVYPYGEIQGSRNRKDLQIHASWVDYEDIVLSEISQTKKNE